MTINFRQSTILRPSETLSLEKETAPEPKTVNKWRELFGKTEIESTDIFDFYKDAPPVWRIVVFTIEFECSLYFCFASLQKILG